MLTVPKQSLRSEDDRPPYTIIIGVDANLVMEVK